MVKKTMNKHYVHADSYRELLFALYLKLKGKQVIVISKNPDVRYFCLKFIIDCIPFPIYGKYDMFKIKRHADEIINYIDINDCYYITEESKSITL
jgi:hypothetical protein